MSKNYAIINHESAGKIKSLYTNYPDEWNITIVLTPDRKWDYLKSHVKRINFFQYCIFRLCKKILNKINEDK